MRKGFDVITPSTEEELLKGLNPSQKKAVLAIKGAIQISSVAGSGKTRVLVTRTAYMINVLGIPAEEIALMTFTKKAAEEMQERMKLLISKKDMDAIFCGTSHSFGYRVLAKAYKELNHPLKSFANPERGFKAKAQDAGVLVGNSLTWFAESVFKQLLNSHIEKDVKDAMKEIGMKGLLMAVSKAKNEGLNANEYQEKWANEAGSHRWAMIHFYNLYEQMKYARLSIDSDDMLFLTVRLFREHPEILKQYQRKIKYVCVDETQDNNPTQYELATMLAYPENNLFVVGDDDQCQPVGQKVLTTKGYVNIEELNPKQHKLVSYDKRASTVIGFKDGYNFDINSRDYIGDLICVTADEKTAKCTPNHKWIVKWSEKAKEKETNVVYMMQKGGKFRIGWCQLFNSEGALHLGARARLEDADNVWILKFVNEKQEASKWESIIATKFGLPLVMFKEHGKNTYSQDVLDDIFSILNADVDMSERAESCLLEYGRDFKYPLWSKETLHTKRGGKTIFEIHACNLESEYFKIPSHTGSKVVEWENVSISKQYYNGKVYSMDVEKYELYITEGLVTHNCMYKFRGAEPNLFINFTKTFKGAQQYSLEDNYRSHPHILSVANMLIANNKNRIVKKLIPHKTGDDKAVYYSHYNTEAEEATELVKELITVKEQRALDNKDFVVIYRTNAQCKEVEDALITNGIPYIIHGGFSFYERKEVKDIMAYLRLVLNKNDNEAYTRACKVPARYIGEAYLTKLKTAKGASLWDATLKVNLTPTEQKATNSFKQLVNSMTTLYQETKDIPDLIEYLLDNGYGEHLRNQNDDADEEEVVNPIVDKIISFAGRFESLQKLVEYVELMTSKRKDSVNGVQLMTIHRSKGLEFPVVFGVGINENLLPHRKAIEAEFMGDEDGIEEERRLAYVLVTRAEQLCYLSSTDFFNDKYCGASRFVAEMALEPDNIDQNVEIEEMEEAEEETA